MDRRDIYDTKARWESWKQNKQLEGVKTYDAKLIVEFLLDWELGKNVSRNAVKGERSYIRLLSLKSRLVFISRAFKKKKITELTKDDVHKLFNDMRTGKLTKADGSAYKSTGDYIKDLKCFWGWLMKKGRVKKNIVEDLSQKEAVKPAWVYLNENQFKQLANRAIPDYRALIWLMLDSGARVTEAYSIKVSDFQDDYKQLTIREETAKNRMGRTIHLKLCSQLIKEYVEFHKLQREDFLFQKKQPAFNKYLKSLSKRLFGDSVSHPKAKGTYDKFTLYDIRHNASCYWLKRYSSTRALMYRMGWSSERFVKYYSEFLGLNDELTDEDMVLGEDKGKLQELEAENKSLLEKYQQLDKRLELMALMINRKMKVEA